MPWFLRHLIAIAVLPFTVAVLIPVWLARRYGTRLVAGNGAAPMLVQFAGVALMAVGLILFVTSVQRFVVEGRGTLAPWDPPRQLVVRGPYRYVRNPMISGVLLVLCGEGLILRSGPHLLWALLFFAINAIYIPLAEEPGLERRFGEVYREYRRHVHRLVPRLRPWEQTRR